MQHASVKINSLELVSVPLMVYIQYTLYNIHYTCTVEPVLSAELDYPRFFRPKFDTPNLNEIQ